MTVARKVHERERRANMSALLIQSGLSIKEIEEHVRQGLKDVRKAFPNLKKAKDDYWDTKTKSKGPDIYNWPTTRESEIVGIAICDAVIALGDDQALLPYSEMNTATALSGSRALCAALERTGFWKFSRTIGLDSKARKEIAVDRGIGTYYLWPKDASQFIYIVAAKSAVAQCPENGCLAVVGVFTLVAPRNANATIQKGQAFYLLGGGRLLERGHWKSEFVGINEEQIMIHYVLSYRRPAASGREYAGLISLNRSPEAVAIEPVDCGGFLAEGTRGYRGEFYSLGPADLNERGEFYCEELEHPVPTEKQLRKLFETSHAALLGKLRINPAHKQTI